jgi:hypothetical protein
VGESWKRANFNRSLFPRGQSGNLPGYVLLIWGRWVRAVRGDEGLKGPKGQLGLGVQRATPFHSEVWEGRACPEVQEQAGWGRTGQPASAPALLGGTSQGVDRTGQTMGQY